MHYAVQLFEGMKAYKKRDGKIVLFRPDKNMDRMYSSALRSALPVFDKVGYLFSTFSIARVNTDSCRLKCKTVSKRLSTLNVIGFLIVKKLHCIFDLVLLVLNRRLAWQ